MNGMLLAAEGGNSDILLIVTFVLTIVLVFLVGITILLVLNVRGKLTTQKLKFHGLSSQDAQTREKYAEVVIGNRSLNNFGIMQIGILNGKTRYDLTGLYRTKANLEEDERIMIEQRASLTFKLSGDELASCLTDGKNGKKTVGKLRFYAIDSTGTMFTGNLREVKKLVIGIMNDVNSGNPPKAPVKGLKPLGSLGDMKPLESSPKSKGEGAGEQKEPENA